MDGEYLSIPIGLMMVVAVVWGAEQYKEQRSLPTTTPRHAEALTALSSDQAANQTVAKMPPEPHPLRPRAVPVAQPRSRFAIVFIEDLDREDPRHVDVVRWDMASLR